MQKLEIFIKRQQRSSEMEREAEKGPDIRFAESDSTVARCRRIEEEREF